jgi:lysozyme
MRDDLWGEALVEISDQGVAVLRQREGCELEAYYDSVGVLTIGVGHTAAAGEPVPVAGMTLTQEEADALFDQDLDCYELCVAETVTEPMTQFQYDAFVSICFNIGQSGFATSTFVERFNLGDVPGCYQAILWWDEPSEIIPRRQAEAVQFMGGYVPRIKEIE